MRQTINRPHSIAVPYKELIKPYPAVSGRILHNSEHTHARSAAAAQQLPNFYQHETYDLYMPVRSLAYKHGVGIRETGLVR